MAGTLLVAGQRQAVRWSAAGQATLLQPLPGHTWTNAWSINATASSPAGRAASPTTTARTTPCCGTPPATSSRSRRPRPRRRRGRGDESVRAHGRVPRQPGHGRRPRARQRRGLVVAHGGAAPAGAPRPRLGYSELVDVNERGQAAGATGRFTPNRVHAGPAGDLAHGLERPAAAPDPGGGAQEPGGHRLRARHHQPRRRRRQRLRPHGEGLRRAAAHRPRRVELRLRPLTRVPGGPRAAAGPAGQPRAPPSDDPGNGVLRDPPTCRRRGAGRRHGRLRARARARPGGGLPRAPRRMAGQRRAPGARRRVPRARRARRAAAARRRSASGSACSPSRPATSPTSCSIQFQVEPPVPSLADVGYLGFYPLACAGVIATLRRGGARDPALWLDGVLGAVGAATALADLLNPVLTSIGGEPAVVLVSRRLSRRRPAADRDARRRVRGPRRATAARSPGWRSGLLCFCAADVVYALRVASANTGSARRWTRCGRSA